MAESMLINHKRALDAYRQLAGASDQVLQKNTMFAMGLLLAGDFPYAHAALVLLYERAWPEKAADLRKYLGLESA